MEKKDIKISSCIIRLVAEKLKNFIEDHEASFKFQPWQMSSTLGILKQTIHKGLHERGIHYLWDTGTAREILNFSKKKKSSVKVQEVVEYLYSFLGISISQVNSKHNEKRNKSHESWHSVPKCSFSNNPMHGRIFEVKKLVESVAQELAYLFSLSDDCSNSTQYSWKVSRYHMTSVKKQKLVCCSYPSCLFNIRKQHWYKKHKALRKKVKKVPIKKNAEINTSKYKQAGLLPRTLTQKKAINLHIDSKTPNKIQIKLPVRKSTVNTATQTTSWKQQISSSFSSSYEDTLIRVCGEEESCDEEEFYCKSDTLNDASMITEEIASEFDVDNQIPLRTSNKLDSDLDATVVPNGKPRRRSNSSNYLSSQANGKTELSNISRSNVNYGVFSKSASSKRRSFENSRDFVGNQLRVQPLTSKSPNVSSRSKTRSISSTQRSTRNNTMKINSPKISNSKEESSMKEKHKRSSSDQQEKYSSSSVKQNPKTNMDGSKNSADLSEKDLDSTKKISKDNVIVSLESSDLENEFNIEQVKNLSKIFDRFDENGAKATPNSSLPIATSSENETTYLPILSSSENASAEEENTNSLSSVKENDNMSPDYSSHWTEEFSSSEVSESEVDESFKRRFIIYKKTLLDDDDGIIASSEEENISSKNDEDIHASLSICNSEYSTKHEMLLDGTFIENIEEFKKRLEAETNLLQNVDDKGWNLLHLAASKGLENVLKELLKYGIPIESRTRSGYTPLKIAITNNHLKCCKVLLQNGASLLKDDGTFDKEVLEMANTSPMKRLLMKYDENLRRLKMISEVLNNFGDKKKNVSTLLSKNLLQSLADLTLEEDEQLSTGLS